MKRRDFNIGAICCLAGIAFNARAQGYPVKPVRIVVPYAPGGSLDAIARQLSFALADVWPQSVIVENRPGANEIIGASEVARAPADGYTLLLATDATTSQNRHLFSKLPYDDEKAFTPVTRVVRVDMCLYVPSNFPANNLKEFITYARANPGLPYASVGVGNVTHLAMASFAKAAELDLLHVPYKGQGPVIADMLSGQVPVALGAVSVLEPYIKSGKLKAIAIAGTQRAKLLPDVQTFSEAGFPKINASYNIGLLAPAGTNAEVLTKIAADVRKVIFQPAFREKNIDAVALAPIGDTPDEYKSFLLQDKPLQQQRIKDIGAKLD